MEIAERCGAGPPVAWATPTVCTRTPASTSSTGNTSKESLFLTLAKLFILYRCSVECFPVRFYLSLENALCGDYITEKAFLALQLNTVPVVMGGESEVKVIARLLLLFSQLNNVLSMTQERTTGPHCRPAPILTRWTTRTRRCWRRGCTPCCGTPPSTAPTSPGGRTTRSPPSPAPRTTARCANSWLRAS